MAAGLWDAFALFDAQGRARPAAKKLISPGGDGAAGK